MILAIMTMATVCASAQSDKTPVDAYFTTSEMPDMLKWCPAPPDTMSAHFAYDITQYFWGKTMRLNKERADIAIRDAVYGIDCIIREFSEPFDLQISKEETPEIYKVLREGTATCDSICKWPKRYYMRKPQERQLPLWSHPLRLEFCPAALRDQSRPCRHAFSTRFDVRREPRHRWCPLAERCRCRPSGRFCRLRQIAHQ